MRYPCIALLGVLALGASSIPAANPATTPEAVRTLGLVRAWVHGTYNNRTQFERDLAMDLPPEKIHRQMNQFFAPVTVEIPGVDGYLVYQHASTDGSLHPEALFRIGLLQYFTDPASGKLVQRELTFRNGERWKNAYQQPELLKQVTMADVNVNPGCDFYLTASADGREVTGTMKEKACSMYSAGLGKTLYAEDAVLIRPAEYGFWGRFVDEGGTVRWGTESEELFQLFRVNEPREP